MNASVLGIDEIRNITHFVDIEAPPPNGEPTAHLIFGTNQIAPAKVAADRYRLGLAPVIIVTGGVNRHTGVVEGQVFRTFLLEDGVPDEVIRVEDRSANTPENVENALPFIYDALGMGLRITAISKWYHRRTVHLLKTMVDGIGSFYALSWEPIYASTLVTRDDWPQIPDGARRVVREWEEVKRRVANGSFLNTTIIDGAWR